MKPVLAIARIAIRNAVRSRVVVVLLGVLLLAVIALPLTIRGDGTLQGKAQILLTYTLGSVSAILSIATIWAGCAAVSQEIESRQIHLILTKPVSRLQVWLGKWLGLLIMNALLLLITGGVIYGMLRWHTRAEVLSDAEQKQLREEILVARRVVKPEVIDVEPHARQVFEEQQRRGLLPADTPPDQLLQAIKDAMLVQAYTVPTGYKREWRFDLPNAAPSTRPLVVRYRFSSSQLQDAPVHGIWLLGPADSADREQVRVANVPEGEHTITIPPQAIGTARRIALEFANVNPVPVAVLFDANDGVQLMVFEGNFEWNFVRSLLVMFCQLAFLGALAVSAGTLVSLPVAALGTAYIVLLIKIGDYLHTISQQMGAYFGSSGHPGVKPEPSILDAILRGMVAVQGWIVQPLRSPNPLDHLAVGELVSWEWVGMAFVVKMIFYSGILALVAAWLFNRREIGVPA